MKWAITIMIARNLIPGYGPGINFLADFSRKSGGACAQSCEHARPDFRLLLVHDNRRHTVWGHANDFRNRCRNRRRRIARVDRVIDESELVANSYAIGR